MAFVFNTGVVTHPIQDERGVEIGSVSYNPKDFGILVRAKESEAVLDEITEAFAKFAESDGGEKAALDTMSAASGSLKKYCDFVFGNGFYEGAFSKLNPFTELNDKKWFCVAVIESVLDDIRQRAAKNKELADKYLKGYKNA